MFAVDFRNNFAFGRGLSLNLKGCANRIRVYNNTLWNGSRTGSQRSALKMEGCYQCDIRNNIIRCADPGKACVSANYDSTAPGVVWQNNIVVNDGGENAQAIRNERGTCTSPSDCDDTACFPGSRTAGRCTGGQQCCRDVDCPANEKCKGANCDPQFPGFMPGWDKQTGDTILLENQRSVFRAEGDGGKWFGPESGDSDRWGSAPRVVNAGAPSAPNLHLAPVDVTAKDRGGPIAGVDGDYDRQGRPHGSRWDIGADEVVGASALPPPVLRDVKPVK
jgi:hypothetical protein